MIFVLLFVYVFGGAIAGRPHDYLEYVLPAILVQTLAFSSAPRIGVNLNTDIGKGVFDRFRVLPIPRSAPLVGAVLGDVVRYVIGIRRRRSASATSSASGSRPTRVRAFAGCLVVIGFALSLAGSQCSSG